MAFIQAIIRGEDGIARLRLADENDLTYGEALSTITKGPDEFRGPHGPDREMVLEMEDGEFALVIPSEDGSEEIRIELKCGSPGADGIDRSKIICADFSKETMSKGNARFCFFGHWSIAGKNGARFARRAVSFPAERLKPLNAVA